MHITETVVNRDNGKLLSREKKTTEKLLVLAKTAIQSIFTYKYTLNLKTPLALKLLQLVPACCLFSASSTWYKGHRTHYLSNNPQFIFVHLKHTPTIFYRFQGTYAYSKYICRQHLQENLHRLMSKLLTQITLVNCKKKSYKYVHSQLTCLPEQIILRWFRSSEEEH